MDYQANPEILAELSEQDRQEYLQLVKRHNEQAKVLTPALTTGHDAKHGDRTLLEVAELLNITPERVRQIEKVALLKARRSWLNKYPNN